MRIPDLESEVHKYQGLNRYITYIKQYMDKASNVKGPVVLVLTTCLVLAIFVFDVKVSKIVGKIPLLSSIIDTKVLEEFESINTSDEFYQALVGSPSETENVTNSTSPGSSDAPGEENSANISDVPQKPLPAATQKNALESSPVLQKLLPKDARIQDAKVRIISDSERIFRITLAGGVIRYVHVVRETDGKYRISSSSTGE